MIFVLCGSEGKVRLLVLYIKFTVLFICVMLLPERDIHTQSRGQQRPDPLAPFPTCKENTQRQSAATHFSDSCMILGKERSNSWREKHAEQSIPEDIGYFRCEPNSFFHFGHCEPSVMQTLHSQMKEFVMLVNHLSTRLLQRQVGLNLFSCFSPETGQVI